MKMREFEKQGAKGLYAVYLFDELVIVNQAGSSCHYNQADFAGATKYFNELVGAKEKAGWTETDRSLSRRVFFHGENKLGNKFWLIWLDRNTISVQWGKVPRWWSDRTGQI